MNIKDIAKLAGVSASTVSKVMNNKAENIAPETQARILKIAREYNYVPYSSIRNASPVKSYTLAVLFRDFLATGKFIQGVLQAAAESGYSILLYDCANSEESELKYISAICRLNADGVIWDPVSEASLANARYFEQADIPITYINDPAIEGALYIDIRRMAYLCTEKLIEKKHHRISCILNQGIAVSRYVEEGFRDCLFDNEIVFTESMVKRIPFDAPLADVISLKDTGFLCSDLPLARRIYEYLDGLHYSIPDDYSIISLEQDIRDAASGLGIVTCAIPYLEFGYTACLNLIGKLEGRRSNRSSDLLERFIFDEGSSVGVSRDSRKKKIIVCGNIDLDYNFIVDELKPAGEITPIKHISTSIGGRGCNQAVACSRLAQETILLGKVGNDSDANEIIDSLNKSGIVTEAIVRESEADSGKAFIYTPHTGDSSFTISAGANSLVDAAYIGRQAQLFRNTGCALLAAEGAQDAQLAFLQLARQNGAVTIVKPVGMDAISPELAAGTDYLIPDRKQAARLFPQAAGPEEQAQALHELGIPQVIITLGQDGCLLCTDDETRHYPAAHFPVVDRNGGSDAFIAAFASFLNEGFDRDAAIRLAQYAAGFCISLQGVFSSFADRNTLFAYVEKNEPELLNRL
ncbi:MAG: LacI family DNA-binding transcriptional regulator [Clostridia bacterium]|nr:LacI family DNA-binding transcriptional regulator [Clostridia bacterium]